MVSLSMVVLFWHLSPLWCVLSTETAPRQDVLTETSGRRREERHNPELLGKRARAKAQCPRANEDVPVSSLGSLHGSMDSKRGVSSGGYSCFAQLVEQSCLSSLCASRGSVAGWKRWQMAGRGPQLNTTLGVCRDGSARRQDAHHQQQKPLERN